MVYLFQESGSTLIRIGVYRHDPRYFTFISW